MEFITSKRGKKMNVIDGFKFNFLYKSVQTNISRYHCFIKTSIATVYVDDDNILISKTDMLKNVGIYFNFTFSSTF
jgi:hypothetical protein